MFDYQFLQSAGWRTPKWVISAPRRARRPDVARGSEPVCPFCPGPFDSAQGKQENLEEEVYRIPSTTGSTPLRQGFAGRVSSTSITSSEHKALDTRGTLDTRDTSDWAVRVLSNKYPFAPIHQVIIHSPDHHKNFDQLSLKQVQLILETYRHQYNEYAHKGQVYIFHNRGEAGGESLPHPHSQLAVVPFEVKMDIPRLEGITGTTGITGIKGSPEKARGTHDTRATLDTSCFSLFCPESSQWPDEVWVAPKKRGRAFGEITDGEIVDLSHILQRLIQIFDLRHGNNFPFNFYIYPGGDWYLRIIPRIKVLGGFELGTGIFVNTQKPEETQAFIKEHFDVTAGGIDQEKIKQHHQAEYEVRA